ncbi:hypothetical protein N0V83_000617 [Neocucurbitaria cava]|uniref:F-box domain-containing protein n=1 Tax=Neocucurbitaria cava TaxID=798079 RepID=A0A9W8YH29_9PLEO|nr:hypothetical protein N0V83_000617 [Neocucurbitaria cava]
MSTLPVEIWLTIFGIVDDLDTLWSIARNVSHYLRDCVDEYFVHGVVQTAFRYHKETQQPKPRILNYGKRARDRPKWEKEHKSLMQKSNIVDVQDYLGRLIDHTTIGRGDRPPYYLNIRDHVHDTELVDLEVDCASCEVSFDWRRTFSAFFMEQHFVARTARRPTAEKTPYDQDLHDVAGRQGFSYSMRIREEIIAARRPRRKRLQSWVARNKRRMAAENRLYVEGRAEVDKALVRRQLRTEYLLEIVPEDLEAEDPFARRSS